MRAAIIVGLMKLSGYRFPKYGFLGREYEKSRSLIRFVAGASVVEMNFRAGIWEESKVVVVVVDGKVMTLTVDEINELRK